MTRKTGQADARMDARTLAALIGDAPGSHALALGRKVNDKRVRSVARDTIDRFVNRTGYTAHAYTVDEATAIVDAMRASGRGHDTVQGPDAARALLGAGTASKARKTARKGRKAQTAPEARAEAQDAPEAQA